ncbi:MAG: hypothetical protein AABW85_00850 [archaeon]
MKKTIIAFFALMLLAMPLAMAQSGGTIGDAIKEGVSKAIKKGIELAENRLLGLKNKINNNPKISDATKTALSETIDIVVAGLAEFTAKAEAATTLEELRQIKQETIQYLKDNKYAIKENLKTAAAEIGTQTKEKAEELKTMVDQTIKVLKVTCQKEISTITKIEGELGQLDTEINLLTQAINAKDPAAIKQEVKKINNISTQLVQDAKYLQQACIAK